MKAVTCDAILTSARTRADGSLGISFATPELTAESKTVFFELLNRNLKMLLQPSDEQTIELHEVKNKLGFKTPGQRLRAVIFLEFKQKNPDMTFDEFYIREMDKLIELRKQRLGP